MLCWIKKARIIYTMSTTSCNKNIDFKYCLDDTGNNVKSIEITVTNEELERADEEFKQKYSYISGKNATITINNLASTEISNYELGEDVITQLYELFRYKSGTSPSTATSSTEETSYVNVNGNEEHKELQEVHQEIEPTKHQDETTNVSNNASNIEGTITLEKQEGGKSSSLRKSRRKRRKSKTMSRRDYIII